MIETSTVMPLIKLLADGQFHSGDELGTALAISRTAVWKQIQKLESIGLEVMSAKGKGYKLSQPLELLNGDEIQQRITPDAKKNLQTLELYLQTGSTNDVAMSMASQGAGSGYLCLAEQQTAGKGRRGRHWVSPFGANLYLSCLWDFYNGAAALEGLSLATGVAVAEALAEFGVAPLELKWPNDVLSGGRKLAGILLEMTGDPSGHCKVIIGVGINHQMPHSSGASIDQPWISLQEICPGISRNALAAAVISQLFLMLANFRAQGFAAYRERWQKLDCFRDREVVIKTGAKDIEGVADGIDSTGGLRLITPEGLQVMKGGEVSVRLSK